ncbi:MAG TPA: citrate synthase/methylcitrate synthase [Gammaproteobacteria bacterium]|nr:citrate synthase/methylcitrate synthase [Gammaproteobacteria bacterium]
MDELRIGLEGIAVAETKISCIDGETGRLIYRGELVEDAIKDRAFEDIAYLLWNGTYPTKEQSENFKKTLANHRNLPDYVKAVIKNLPSDLDAMSVLRTAVSALHVQGSSWPPTQEQAIEILAKAPVIIAFYYHNRQGQKEIPPDPSLGHVENYLYMLTGKKPELSHLRALETYLMLAADHDMNASTFTARVVTSTQADIVSAIVAAIGALKGPLHGGAPSEVENMLDEIGNEANAEAWIRAQLDKGERIMGFGHRVYKTYDPRAVALKAIVKQFSADNAMFKLSLAVEEKAIELLNEYKPGRKLFTNLEFWAAGVLRTINIPKDLYTPTFSIGRIAGWSAQILEQAEHNRIIRPGSVYVGKKPSK